MLRYLQNRVNCLKTLAEYETKIVYQRYFRGDSETNLRFQHIYLKNAVSAFTYDAMTVNLVLNS